MKLDVILTYDKRMLTYDTLYLHMYVLINYMTEHNAVNCYQQSHRYPILVPNVLVAVYNVIRKVSIKIIKVTKPRTNK